MSGPWEKYAQEEGPWAKYAPKEAPKEEEGVIEKVARVAKLATPAGIVSNLFSQKGRQDIANNIAGGVRGAGSIGATVMRPFETGAENQQRRQAMDAALTDLGADTQSMPFQLGKLSTEVGGTAGAGGAVANALARVPRVAAPNLLNAIRTGGMSGGSMPVRMAGGVVSSGASAGLIDPEYATTGAAVGGVLPPALKAVGVGANALGRLVSGPQVSDDVLNGLKAAREAGYVVPPTQAKPTLVNRVLEGTAGKITTAQNASAKNQAVTNSLAKRELGIADDAPITTETLDAIRSEAGKAYGAISKLGKMDASGAPSALKVRTDVAGEAKRKFVDSADVIETWKQANHDATAYYRQYARDANPETLAKAKQASSTAKQIDAYLEKQLQAMGKGDMLQALKDARVRIAKTHTVEEALNPATGNVDAGKLAARVKKNKPLSGGLKQAGEFAARFPKAAQVPQQMGSLPQTSPLDWVAGGAMSAATSNPLMMAGVLARPASRSLALSPVVQNRLASPASQSSLNLLADPALQALLYRSAPALAADR